MPKKKYNSDSLYFTDRKAYYEQKKQGNQIVYEKSLAFDYFKTEGEKIVGFAGGDWDNDSPFGRSLGARFGINTTLLKRFPNLADKGNTYTSYNGYITIQEVVWLCQKAWEEFQLFRNTIEAMVEFSMSKLKLSSKNKSAKNFCETWLKAINIEELEEQFYRELYRSCNVFAYPMYGKINQKDIKSLKMYAAEANIPVKYTIMNPAQIALHGGITSDNDIYKVLSPYEIKRLKNPKTEAEKTLYNKLDPELKKQIKEYSGQLTQKLYINLKNVNPVFYQKQDYEYFATPLFYGILDDIELKMEMKKADKKVLKSLENMILKVTMGGYKIDNNEMPPNPEHITYLRKLFENPQAQRVLVGDYTTEVEYIIPNIKQVVGEEKYKQVNTDIAEGLQSIFGSNEKFANAMTKARVFVARLEGGRRKFKKWLEGEMGSVCKAMGYSETPSIKMSTINLEDSTQIQRVFLRMAELGFLTAEELTQAIEDGILPNAEDSLESQKRFYELKKKDLYYPQLNNNAFYEDDDEQAGGDKKANDSAGRPAGTTQPQSGPKKQRVVGNISGISIKDFGEFLHLFDNLNNEVSSKIKAVYKVESLSEAQVNFAKSIANQIISNYDKNDWISAAEDIVKNQKIKNNSDMQASIEKICEDFELDDDFLGAAIYHSQISQKK